MGVRVNNYCSRKITASILALTVWASMQTGAFGQEVVPTEVILHERGYGWLFTDTKGMTLYTYSPDIEQGKPACIERCAEIWRPLVAPNEAEIGDEWSAVVRDYGSLQWAFWGQPLYSYTKDNTPGDMNGDEVERGRWQVAIKPIITPVGVDVYETVEYGYLLVDLKRMTLYTSDADAEAASACDSSCARTWRPLEAPWLMSNIGNFSIIRREDGRRQWAFKNKPLYTYAGDAVPGDASGNGLGTWRTAVLEPPLPIPDWVTVQDTDSEPVLADSRGMTLYAHRPRSPDQRLDRDGVRRIDIHRPLEWKPVLAEPDAKHAGFFSIAENTDGQKQWSYKGLLLYVNLYDERPGQLSGTRGLANRWLLISKSGKVVRGVPGQQF